MQHTGRTNHPGGVDHAAMVGFQIRRPTCSEADRSITQKKTEWVVTAQQNLTKQSIVSNSNPIAPTPF